ncbi:retinol dehydrogenase [Elysia marginata]|uniref:Retinol dehydrogenase n=1 Tax=Elysia marginata TaxID=1093978 RepID=A0AAV4J4Y8_9GAST|nr:retinol dehydrogenase [Elysia marginata]
MDVFESFAFDITLEAPVDERIDFYLDYLLKTYTHSSSLFPPTVWASSGFNIKRTTNGCEAFHKQLNSMFYSAHPTVFELVDRLQDVESGFEMRGADDTARSKTASERKKEVWIEEIKKQFEDGTIDRKVYLRRISCTGLPATRGTSGIGKATALELAKRNARVLLTGREKSKVEAVARNIRKKTGNQQVNALVLDLASLRNIREFARDFVKDEKSLHVLINNAAYMGPKAATDDGLERGFGVNYLGHFYLTHLLTDKLRKNAPSRIINVVSSSYADGELDFEDLALNKNFDTHKSYARSKLAQVIFNYEIHRRLISGCVWTFGVHPGCVKTELQRSYPGLLGNALRVFARFMFKTPEEGCQTVVYCAVADGLRDFSGKVFSNCKVMKIKDSLVKDHEKARELFKVSAQLCGFEDELAQNAPELPAAEKADDEKKTE